MPAFPPGFRWGSATAAYQIEGAVAEGGRGPSIWDTFSHTPGRVQHGDTGDVADDHYHRYADDVAIMRELHLGAYRFSVSWPRVQPAGTGPLNPAGIDFYDRLLDELHGAGMVPWLTLYHWDLPQPLEDAGGWPQRDTALRFADYARAVHERFADRVADWTTLNEPWCSAFLGYFTGHHAPGRTEPAESLRAVHHLLLGHGLAVQAMRGQRPEHRFGITLNLYPVDPASDSAADRNAARRVDGISNRLFTDPVLRGWYPDDVLADLAAWWPEDLVHEGDLAVIGTPLDQLGVNYYSRHVVRAVGAGAADGAGATGLGAADAAAGAVPATPARDNGWIGCDDVVKIGYGYPRTTMGWEIDAPGLHDILTWLHRSYPGLPPVYITENGASFDDVVSADGAVHDPDRTAYLDAHFRQAARAIADGVDLRGYFVWSLLDNFEWSWGYQRRFGIVHVDYHSLRRTIKDSGYFVARVAAANGLPDGGAGDGGAGNGGDGDGGVR
jgi:beta-glucosidase